MESDKIVWEPSRQRIKQANVTRFMREHSINDLQELHQKSVQDTSWFWDACIKDLGIQWFEHYNQVQDKSAGIAWTKWFKGGKTNIVLNCIDQHIAQGRGTNTAFIWEGECGAHKKITYQQLDSEVESLANALKKLGLKKGDRVCLYMPMIPEMVYAFFAILKLGAIVVPVFSGFGSTPLAVRLNDAQVKMVFTADGSLRRGKEFSIKDNLDLALKESPSVEKVIVAERLFDKKWKLKAGRDYIYSDLINDDKNETCETEIMDAEDPALIIYTSGTTGKPKGCVHTHAGSLAQIVKEHAYNFDLKSDDLFFWLTDIGWMMGPWLMIGSLHLNASFLIYEGAPDFPDVGRLWEIIDSHQVSVFGISPTAIRLLKKSGTELLKNYSLASLKTLGSTGEAWDEDSYHWFYKNIGKNKCPIINISGGTEIIGCLVAPLPIAPIKELSLQGPGLGMDVEVLDENKNRVRGEIGYLVCRQAAPSMTKGFLNDPKRYIETYFSHWPEFWFHGDWAYVDKDGHWFIRGRADDTIKVSGRRTGPAEVESAAMQHETVAEAAVIGIPHEIKGEGLIVFVVLKSESLKHPALVDEIQAKMLEVLGKTLKPEKIHIVEALPKTRSGKVVRQLIKKHYLGGKNLDLSSVENSEIFQKFPINN